MDVQNKLTALMLMCAFWSGGAVDSDARNALAPSNGQAPADVAETNAGNEEKHALLERIRGMRRGFNEADNPVRNDRGLVRQYLDDIYMYYQDYGDVDLTVGHVYGFAYDILSYPRRYGLSDRELKDFVDQFRASSDAQIRKIPAAYDARVRRRDVPLEFAAPLFTGGRIDLADLRGKIVYIDPWTTTCTGCIAAMPELHETYLSYKDMGFAFVSVLYDGKEQEAYDGAKRARRVIHDLKLTWPTVVADDQRVTDIGAGGYFPYMVLDRDGTVYEFHDRKERTLAEILDEMLGKEAIERGEEYISPQ